MIQERTLAAEERDKAKKELSEESKLEKMENDSEVLQFGARQAPKDAEDKRR